MANVLLLAFRRGLSNAHSRPLMPVHSHGGASQYNDEKRIQTGRAAIILHGSLCILVSKERGPATRMAYDQSMTKRAAQALTEPHGTKASAVTKYL